MSTAEGAFKKLKPEPGGTVGASGGASALSPALGPQHAGHTPTTASCPTPARRRHRTTFTQVIDSFNIVHKLCVMLYSLCVSYALQAYTD